MIVHFGASSWVKVHSLHNRVSKSYQPSSNLLVIAVLLLGCSVFVSYADEVTASYSNVENAIDQDAVNKIFKNRNSSSSGASDYSYDCSFAIHEKNVGTPCNNLLGDRKRFYEEYVEGCRNFFGGTKGERCDLEENFQFSMMQRQPQSMINYTNTGYAKVMAPSKVMNELKKYWEMNKNIHKEKEVWSIGNTVVNYWSSPTYMVDVNFNPELKKLVWEETKSTLEEWTQQRLRPSSLYGIRVYTNDAVLRPHVDRLPLVSSCIINVDQDIDEPWPLEIYDRSGKAVNITLEPGEMVLYESHSLIHGRPFALKGRYYANIFVHFEPVGPLVQSDDDDISSCDDDETMTSKRLPPYIIPGSPEVENWKEKNPQGWQKPKDGLESLYKRKLVNGKYDYNPVLGHYAALVDDITLLAELYIYHPEYLTKQDDNGWQPIHEAVRKGHLASTKLLLAFGADVNALTKFGQSVLNIALEAHPGNNNEEQKHPLIRYLESRNAINVPVANQYL